MSLELHHTYGCTKWATDCQRDLYESANKESIESPYLMRLSGIGLGIASSAIALAGKVGSIGETAIKGIANIFGSPFSDDCKCIRGVKQIFIYLPHAILGLILSPIPAVINLLIDTAGMVISPARYSDWKQQLSPADRL